MGLLKAALGALSGTFADQWKDFYTVPEGLRPTAALFSAVLRGTNAGRGSNTSASEDVITNGSVLVVPEGYALILMQDGAITGLVTVPGAYIWDSEAQDSSSVFVGDDRIGELVKTSWERFKFGGRPQSQQRAFFVSLKELPNNRFATASEIYWDDAYIGAQVGAHTRGSYTLTIADPILFVRNFVPAKYLQPGQVFDFTDLQNDASQQLFNEVLSSLAPAFARYSNDADKGGRITRIQQDSAGFSTSLAAEVERVYRWRSERGLEVTSTAIISMEYDDHSRELLRTVQRSDALTGSRGNANLQASVAAGLEAAGSVEGAAGIVGLGIASGSAGVDRLQQPAAASPVAAEPAAEDPTAELTRFKGMLDAGLIDQGDYDAVKRRVLGL